MAYISDEYQDDPALLFPYSHATWDKGEVLYFTDEKSDLDTKRYEKLSKQLLKQNPDIGEVQADNFAFILSMGRYWTVKYPKTFKQVVRDDITGEAKVDPETGRFVTEPHPKAGKIMPFDLEHIRKLGEPVWVDAARTAAKHYGDQFPQDAADTGGAETAVSDTPSSPDA